MNTNKKILKPKLRTYELEANSELGDMMEQEWEKTLECESTRKLGGKDVLCHQWKSTLSVC